MRLHYGYVFLFPYSAVRPRTDRDVIMEIVNALIALLVQYRFIMCTAPEFSVVLDVSVLRAEVINKYEAPQRRGVMLLRTVNCRRVSSFATLGCSRRDADARERLRGIENVTHRNDVLRWEAQNGRRSTQSHRCNRGRRTGSLTSLQTRQLSRVV